MGIEGWRGRRSSHKHTGQSHEKEDEGRLNQETKSTEAKGAKGKKRVSGKEKETGGCKRKSPMA